MQLVKFKSLTKQSRRLIGANRDLHPFANNGDVQLVVMWRELFGLKKPNLCSTSDLDNLCSIYRYLFHFYKVD